jgi:2-polyprenyl-3-methyl-5-hydroxy-6-metoxy-1,4-benzoquinol methylase
MKKASEVNINTKRYWNDIYGEEGQRAMYASQGTDSNSLKHSHWTAQSIKTTRFTTAVKFIKDGDRVLDIGCGVGVFTQLVKKTHPKCDVTGVDISDKAIEANKLENNEIAYYQGYIGRLDAPDEHYDVVFCGETIEHLDDPSILFNEAYKMLKKGGKLIITTPREEHIKSDEHVWYFKQEDVEELFLKAGYKEIKFEYLKDMEHLMVIFAVGTK